MKKYLSLLGIIFLLVFSILLSGCSNEDIYIINNNHVPFGLFTDNTSQQVLVSNTAYPISFGVTEKSYLVSVDSNRQNFSVLRSGVYLIDLRTIATTDVPNRHIQVWLQKNGVNVPRSNTLIEFPLSGETEIKTHYVLNLSTSDTFRLMFASDSTGTNLFYTANTSYSPETPSVRLIVTWNGE